MQGYIVRTTYGNESTKVFLASQVRIEFRLKLVNAILIARLDMCIGIYPAQVIQEVGFEILKIISERNL